MSKEHFFRKRFALIKDQEKVCYKLLREAGIFLGNENAAVFDDYDLDVRNKNDGKRLLDVKIGKTLFVCANNPLPNEQSFYYLKRKTFLKYCKWAQEEDFYIALFHCFFWDEEKILTERYRSFAAKRFGNQIKIEKEISCLLVSVNNLKENLEKCTTQIHLHPTVKSDYLKNHQVDDGTILKINSEKIGIRINLRNIWRQLDEEEKALLMQSA